MISRLVRIAYGSTSLRLLFGLLSFGGEIEGHERVIRKQGAVYEHPPGAAFGGFITARLESDTGK
jgi:hypothetical protein